MTSAFSSSRKAPVLPASHSLERLRENLADFKQKYFHQSRSLYQDMDLQSILTILVRILKMYPIEIGQVFPQAFYHLEATGAFEGHSI
jgi:hypothetical protein